VRVRHRRFDLVQQHPLAVRDRAHLVAEDHVIAVADLLSRASEPLLDVRPQTLWPVVCVARQMRECAERLVRHCLLDLRWRQKPGRQTRLLVRCAVLVDPGDRRGPAFIAQSDVFGTFTGAPLAVRFDVGAEPAQRFFGYVAGGAGIDHTIEAEMPVPRRQITPLGCGRRVDKGPLRLVGEKRERDLGATDAIGIRALVARERPLRVVGPFELMIPRGLAEQLVDRRRLVVDPTFLLYWVQTDLFREFFFAGETGNVNQGNVGAAGIREAPIALPSLAEQHEIVRRVEEHISLSDDVERRVALANGQIDKLTQSIFCLPRRAGAD
jgi:hypothetical protein